MEHQKMLKWSKMEFEKNEEKYTLLYSVMIPTLKASSFVTLFKC